MFYLFVAAVCGLNIFDWWRLHLAFLKGHPVWSAVTLAVMLLMLLAPAWMRSLFQHGSEPRWLVQASWIWLALSFWLCSALLVVLLWNLAGNLLCIARGGQVVLPEASSRMTALIAIGFTLAATIWGVLEANAIRVKTVDVICPQLPEGLDEYRIALISDVHIGPAATTGRIEKTVRLVNDAKPDLIISAGDLIDGASEREKRLARMLTQINASSGFKLAVYGNHDVYSGLEFSRRCHLESGFALLEDESISVSDWLWVYGKKDPASGRHPGQHGKPQIEDVPQPPDGCFSILIYHRPDVVGDSAAGYSLQCSGHSHGGQIFPFNFFVRMQYPYREGVLHKLDSGLQVYVSPGTGVWGPPFRLMARPEVTLLRLVRR